MASANALAASGDEGGALLSMESALNQDPLSLELHQKYWSFKRRLTQSTHGGGNGR